MAEIIQLQLESMLPELEDLKTRKLFTEDEISSIVKKRTQFEYKLQRRQPLVKDFLLYIEFEIQLDHLRNSRRKRTQPSAKTSLSDYSIQRRIFNLFERALLRNRMDISLWLSYIEYCKASGSTKLISKIFSRVLQFHPRNPTVWILASEFEFKTNLNMSAARALMQRSIRMDAQNPQLWLEYFRLEIQYIEKIRIRRELMTSGKEVIDEVVETDDVIALPDIKESELKHKEPISLSEEVIKSLDNDSEFMKGLLPKIIFNNAIKAIPSDIQLRQDFIEICQPFPHLVGVSEAIYESIERDFEHTPSAIDITIRKDIDQLSQTSSDYGSKLKSTLTQYDDYLKQSPSAEMYELYCKFLNAQLVISKSDKLKSFFLLKLNQLLKTLKESENMGLFSEYTFDYYLRFSVEVLKSPEQALELAEKASELYPNNLTFWLTRLELVDDEDIDTKVKLIDSAISVNGLSEELWDSYWTIKISCIDTDSTENLVELFEESYSKSFKFPTKNNEEKEIKDTIQFNLFKNLLNLIVDNNSSNYIELIRNLCKKLQKKVVFTTSHYLFWISLELSAYQDEVERAEGDKREGFLWHHENKVNNRVKEWIPKITQLYELALKAANAEQDTIELWYDYLTFLSDLGQHAISAKVLNRAKAQLQGADYNQLQNLYKEYLIQSQSSKDGFGKFDSSEVVISH